MPVVVMAQFLLAIGNAAQADERHGKPHGGAQHRIGLHVHHVGVDPIIGGAGDDGGAGGQASGFDGRHAQGNLDHRRET